MRWQGVCLMYLLFLTIPIALTGLAGMIKGKQTPGPQPVVGGVSCVCNSAVSPVFWCCLSVPAKSSCSLHKASSRYRRVFAGLPPDMQWPCISDQCGMKIPSEPRPTPLSYQSSHSHGEGWEPPQRTDVQGCRSLQDYDSIGVWHWFFCRDLESAAHAWKRFRVWIFNQIQMITSSDN